MKLTVDKINQIFNDIEKQLRKYDTVVNVAAHTNPEKYFEGYYEKNKKFYNYIWKACIHGYLEHMTPDVLFGEIMDAVNTKKISMTEDISRIEKGKEGDCYKNVQDWLVEHGTSESKVVHGEATNKDGKRLKHAWIEDGNDVIDPTTGIKLPKEKYYSKLNAKADNVYSMNEVLKLRFKTGHYGPYSTVKEMKKSELKQLISECYSEILKESSMDPQTTLKQLGGNKFIVMTGAKNFVYDNKNNSLGFKIGGGAKNGINYVRVKLTGLDLYNMEFIRLRGNNIKTINTVEDLYADQLQKVFTENTGMYTHL